jgi:molybdate transport system regulatory protein
MKSKWQVRPRIRVFCDAEIALGPGKCDLLALVAETGSIREAAKRMDMSYMRAWTMIRTMNNCFKEPLVESARGGKTHGGATLTPTGQAVLQHYQKMEARAAEAVAAEWAQLSKLLA